MNIYSKTLDEKAITNLYRYGSHVYGTNHEGSDEDFIGITDRPVVSDDINVHLYTAEQFQLLLDNHDIAALECYFIAASHTFRSDRTFNFTLDKTKLRTSISTIVSNSWVKGKKKLTVTGDYDKYLAIKSIFHSLRILDFGIQIALEGRITNYGSMNHVFTELMKMAENDESVTLWNAIETRYKKEYNAQSSKFKSLCPKDTSEKELKSNIRKIIGGYEVNDPVGLLDEIMLIINK